MPKHARRSRWPLWLLATAALTLGLVVPISASARPAGASQPLGVTAAGAEARTSAAEERAARASLRREERAARMSARREERAARAKARREERAALRAERASERNGGAPEQTGNAGAPPESGSEPPRASIKPPEESGTNPASNTPVIGHARKCRASIEASSKRITAGEPVTLFGKLTCPVGESMAKQQVTISQGQLGSGPSNLTPLEPTTTTAQGTYEVTTAALSANSIFRVRESGHGAHTVVKVAPAVSLNAPVQGAIMSKTDGHPRFSARPRATFTGTVTPAGIGRRVALQISNGTDGESWHSVAFGKVGADGSYSIAHGFRDSGTIMVRVLVHTGRHNVAAASESQSYTAPQPENPDLTIQTSADPDPYGGSITVSGAATGASGQAVTLLERTRGGAFTIAEQGTTDEHGDYSFTRAPTQNTSYRVTDSTTASTVAYEAVGSALVPDAAPDTAQSGTQLTFSGTVTPAHAGQPVYLEREYASGLAFHVVETVTMTGTPGYTIMHTFHGSGANVMRIKVPGNGENQTTTSEPFTVTVTP